MEEPTNAVICKECGGVFRTQAGLNAHARMAHKDLPKQVVEPVIETPKVEAEQAHNVDFDKKEQLRKFVAVSLNDPVLNKMFDFICSKPWVRTFIQREQGEPKNATQMIGINGVRFDIPKGAFVDLPTPLVAMLNDVNNISDEFVKQYELTDKNKLGKQL